MRSETALERALADLPAYQDVRAKRGSPAEIQVVLDEVSERVCRALPSSALLEHNKIVYEATAGVYAENPEHMHVPDALLSFMSRVQDGSFVLDIGCGSGRDGVFMALPFDEPRKQFMGRMKDGKMALERFGLPQRTFRVLGIDSSMAMVRAAEAFAARFGLQDQEGESREPWFVPMQLDMHFLESYVTAQGRFDAAWSSAALLMHTPEALLPGALCGVASVLRRHGIFGLSYANNPVGTPYNNLRYSRTHELKYFSRPSPEHVVAKAADAGFLLLAEDFSDLEMAQTVKKDFFVTQLFQKI